jgi:hypothetical protein
MPPKHRLLLTVDAVVNLLLGIGLLLFPTGLIRVLGLPATSTHFYTSILGAVLVGIGLALLVEVRGDRQQVRGLALGGAIVINLCGAGVLLYWLLSGGLELPDRGRVLLWLIVLVVLFLAAVELRAGSWQHPDE